jgi:Ricin-type beta-trefoil lectin domain-like
MATLDITIALKADSGNFAARCNKCIPQEAYPDNVAVHVSDLSKAYAQWHLQKLDNGNYALKSIDSGKYAARCNNCIPGAAYPDSVFVHVDDPQPAYAQWKLERLSNGKYALKSADSGKYFARCNNCAPGASYPDNVFVHSTSASDPWAQWEIIIIP